MEQSTDPEETFVSPDLETLVSPDGEEEEVQIDTSSKPQVETTPQSILKKSRTPRKPRIKKSVTIVKEEQQVDPEILPPSDPPQHLSTTVSLYEKPKPSALP
jgi:hypothetical protein